MKIKSYRAYTTHSLTSALEMYSELVRRMKQGESLDVRDYPVSGSRSMMYGLFLTERMAKSVTRFLPSGLSGEMLKSLYRMNYLRRCKHDKP